MSLPERFGRHAFKAAFAIAATASLVPLWSVRYLPMVDLPQHAAQVFVWSHFFEPEYGFGEIYRLELFSPYLLGHTLMRFFAYFMPLPAASRVLVSLAILALPLALVVLLRRTDSDTWPALLGFPFAFGFAFYWGFTNFLIAVPVTCLFVAAGLGYAREPTRRDGVYLALFAFALYLCHALPFALGMAVVGLAVVTATAHSWRRRALALWPLVPASVLVAAWFLWLRSTDATTAQPNVWVEGFLQRLRDLPAMVLGAGHRDGTFYLGGLLALVLPFVGAVPRRRPALFLPVLAALAAYFTLPNRAVGTWFVYPRYAVFVAVFFLLCLRPAAAAWRRHLGRGLILAFVVAWMIFLTLDQRAYDAEARRFDDLLAEMEAGRSVLGLVFDPGLGYAAGVPVFGHFHLWYQAQKGGVAEYSFAIAYPQLVQYRYSALSPPELSIRPAQFDYAQHGRPFDYFVVRSPVDLGPRLFKGAPVELAVRSGNWWLYAARP